MPAARTKPTAVGAIHGTMTCYLALATCGVVVLGCGKSTSGGQDATAKTGGATTAGQDGPASSGGMGGSSTTARGGSGAGGDRAGGAGGSGGAGSAPVGSGGRESTGGSMTRDAADTGGAKANDAAQAGGSEARDASSTGGASGGSAGNRGDAPIAATDGPSAIVTDAKTGTGGADATGAGTGPAESKPMGYGQATTGGGSKSAVVAATMTDIQAAIDAYGGSGGLVIQYTGHFDFATITDPCTRWKLPAQIVEIKKKNDITLIGADGSAASFGIHVASSSSNIIIRNMVFGLLPGADASDAISIEGMSGGVPTDIWIDHNELFSSMVTCDGAGDTSFDGLIDVKKGADNVTVSYNYIHDHHKVSLNGYSDSDDVTRHITFHHNLFENVGSRTPLQRHGYSHMLNNWFDGITTSGINVRMDGYSLVEGNYFENAQNPVTSRDSDAIGYWELRGNNIASPADFTKYGITWVASSSTPTKDATDWTTTKAYPVALGYTYKVDPPDCLKAGLKKVAGAGKGLATLTCK
jgi:pectate lyase